jgi:hypothetical protein
MVRAFSALEMNGVGDPSKLSAIIGEAMVSTALGFWGGMIGFGLLGFAIFVQRKQPRWVKVVFCLAALPALYGVFTCVMIVFSALQGGGD